MTNEIRINNAELLSEEQLDNVAGGTVAQLRELLNAVAGNSDVLKFLTGATELSTKIFPVANIPLAYAMEDQLKKLGIDSNISVGWFGTDTRESGNTYSRNGQGMSHEEVVQFIQHWRSN